MDDNYIHFKIDGRDLKINKETPEDIFMLRTHAGKYKMKNPKWNQIKVQTNEQGYKVIAITPKKYRLHRVNYYAHNPDWDIHNSCIKTNSIDHRQGKNEIKKHQNNDINNLRIVTHQQNHFNRNCKGYCWDKQRQKWRAQIKGTNGKVKNLGRFNTEEEARQSYLEAKKIYHKIE